MEGVLECVLECVLEGILGVSSEGDSKGILDGDCKGIMDGIMAGSLEVILDGSLDGKAPWRVSAMASRMATGKASWLDGSLEGACLEGACLEGACDGFVDGDCRGDCDAMTAVTFDCRGRS